MDSTRRNFNHKSRKGAEKMLAQENAAQAERIVELEARVGRLEKQAVTLYNLGYHAGHHDTVEAQYTDILACDMDTIHAEEVIDHLAALEEK